MIEDRTCENCKHENKDMWEWPCINCMNNVRDHFEKDTGGWIPCSLAKPINCGNYLVTSKGSTWVAEWYNDTWWGIELETRWTDVEAWQPLPEPYKESED